MWCLYLAQRGEMYWCQRIWAVLFVACSPGLWTGVRYSMCMKNVHRHSMYRLDAVPIPTGHYYYSGKIWSLQYNRHSTWLYIETCSDNICCYVPWQGWNNTSQASVPCLSLRFSCVGTKETVDQGHLFPMLSRRGMEPGSTFHRETSTDTENRGAQS